MQIYFLAFASLVVYALFPIVILGKAPNVIVLVTDDQDVLLGSMDALPFIQNTMLKAGTNMSRAYCNTPICAPSRATILSGRHQHNNRDDAWPGYKNSQWCMYQNVSEDTNPAYFHDQIIARYLKEQGYSTGLFGKSINAGCLTKICNPNGNYTMPPHWDRWFGFCAQQYYNTPWNDQGVQVIDSGEQYSTARIGNETVAWLRNELTNNPYNPVFAYIGVYAPHDPATPAPWYNKTNMPTPPFPTHANRYGPYNVTVTGHHWVIEQNVPLTEQVAQSIDDEHEMRLRSLLSVDDVFRAVYDLMSDLDELDNTYFVFTSDHGYSLGQFNVISHKQLVYESNLRVPMLIAGPGIHANTELALPVGHVDLTPTLLDIVGVDESTLAVMDGRSYKDYLFAGKENLPDSGSWRDHSLIEYSSIYSYRANGPGHANDNRNNTYIGMRIVNATHDWLYAEFTDILDWQFEDIMMYELYDSTTDVFQTNNIYNEIDPSVQKELHNMLRQEFACQGQPTSSGHSLFNAPVCS